MSPLAGRFEQHDPRRHANVEATVTDAKNRPVIDLQKQNFTVYEENEPQEIRNFSTEDAPISVGLILDVSKSMSNKFEVERKAVAEFFQSANPEDDYFVITLGDRPQNRRRHDRVD